MNHRDAKAYLLARPEAYEDFPFGPDLAVIKIGKKMFATLDERNAVASMNLKCDPHEALIPVSYTHLTLPTSDLV